MTISQRVLIALTFATMLLGLMLQMWYYPQLPERMATHFGVDGTPNGWMSRNSAALFQCALQVLLPLLFAGIAWVLPRFPNSMINLPNREYWLAPERRDGALAHMATMLLAVGLACSIFIAAIAHLVFEANRNNAPLASGPFLILFVCFLSTVFAVAGASMWSLRLPSKGHTTH